ncbi:hypothetical protein C1A50_3829 [Paenibacillus polymyxa]|nr:hypothetical protein C1A50_3829 [Paenibacillus polymyxa]
MFLISDDFNRNYVTLSQKKAAPTGSFVNLAEAAFFHF